MIQGASGFRGLSLLFNLNWDRILYVATVLVALFAGAFFGSLLL
ncbi:hypothetical protein ROA7450_01661 [Roseovarius albus]|uniref:Uncharacterized protein n=1 Tax=Roseovarius albus TaxID=1247867 RepID=A0A1X6YZ15_9RHOB|nr:hypothetical protein ROA7450_01661 [Roseovarius albus]